MSDWSGGIDFERIDTALTRAIPIALGRAMEHIHEVVTPKVPIETGHLRGAGGITVKGFEAQIKYPGPYARYQHFGLDFHHPIGGQALYLEQPMLQEAGKALEIVADTLRTEVW